MFLSFEPGKIDITAPFRIASGDPPHLLLITVRTHRPPQLENVPCVNSTQMSSAAPRKGKTATTRLQAEKYIYTRGHRPLGPRQRTPGSTNCRRT